MARLYLRTYRAIIDITCHASARNVCFHVLRSCQIQSYGLAICQRHVGVPYLLALSIRTGCIRAQSWSFVLRGASAAGQSESEPAFQCTAQSHCVSGRVAPTDTIDYLRLRARPSIGKRQRPGLGPSDRLLSLVPESACHSNRYKPRPIQSTIKYGKIRRDIIDQKTPRFLSWVDRTDVTHHH